MDPNTLASRLRSARETAGLSARELDRLAGLAESHTASIESGGRKGVHMVTARKLAMVIGASLDWLIGGSGAGPSARQIRAAVERARAERAA